MKSRSAALLSVVLIGLACNALPAGLGQPTATAVSPPTAAPTTTDPPPPTATVAAPTATAPPPTALPPAYVPPGCENVAPATVPPATAAALPTPSLAANPPIDAAGQMRVLDGAANAVDDLYLYPDYNGNDWPGAVAELRGEVEAGLDTEAFYTRMRELILTLGDEHSYFESPVQVAATAAALAGNSEYVGIGVFVVPLLQQDRASILVVFPESSAFYGGLQPHDSILAVDGLLIVENGVSHPQRLRGPQCSAAVLTVQSPGGAPRDVTFIRNRFAAPMPVGARLVPTADGSRIGYLFLATFFDQTVPGSVQQALEEFGPLDGLILDNRMNGGGSGMVTESMLSLFTSGTLGRFASRSSEQPLTLDANPVQNSQTVPLAILIGEDTVSYGEIFAGVLRDTGRALLVGETTLGNVERLHRATLEDGSELWLAVERFVPAFSESDWEQTGIVPDVEVVAAWDTFTFETDPAVAAALQLLGHP